MNAQKKSTASRIPTKAVILQDYRKRLRDNIKSLTENFHQILQLAKVEEFNQSANRQVPRVSQYAQDQFEIEIRAANMARAGDSLSKLIQDLKLFLILNDFSYVNDSIDQAEKESDKLVQEQEGKLLLLKDDLTVQLYDLEQEAGVPGPSGFFPDDALPNFDRSDANMSQK